MSYGLQVINEYMKRSEEEWILAQAGTTKYIPLSDTSHWDSVHGIWFYLAVHTVGANVTITLQGAVDKNQTTWADIGAGVVVTGGTVTSPVQNSFLRGPAEVAAGSVRQALPPYLRLKFVVDAGTTAGIHKIARSIRGLS